MKSLNPDKIKATGDIPNPRFGHSFTMVSPTKAVLFGGAVSLTSTNTYTQTNSSSLIKPISSILSAASGPN